MVLARVTRDDLTREAEVEIKGFGPLIHLGEREMSSAQTF